MEKEQTKKEKKKKKKTDKGKPAEQTSLDIYI